MDYYRNVESQKKPEAIKIDEKYVCVSSNIVVSQTTDEDGNISESFTFDLARYTKDDYIKRQEEQITEIQLALVELGGI
jgi:hypothetical protein